MTKTTEDKRLKEVKKSLKNGTHIQKKRRLLLSQPSRWREF